MTPVDATVLFVVKDGRRTQAAWSVRLEGGAAVLSAEADPASLPDADVAFTVAAGDVAAVRSGELPITVGFMRGQVKTAGEPGIVLAVLRALDDPDLASTRASLLSG